VELTANVTQLMEAERNTRLNTCGVERGIHRDLPFVRFLGVHVFCHKEMKRGYGIYISYIQSRKKCLQIKKFNIWNYAHHL